MKRILLLTTITLISLNTSGQNWLDNKCNDLDYKVNATEFKEAEDRNILKVIINQAEEIVINGEVKPNLSEIRFKELVLSHITNPKNEKNKATKPESVIIQLKSFSAKSDKLLTYKNHIQSVYIYLWDKASEEKYKSSFIDLNCNKREKIIKSYPYKIIESIEKNKKAKRELLGAGVPVFDGDVKDN